MQIVPVDETAMLEALVSVLEGEDIREREIASKLLAWRIEDRSSNKTPDFRAYRTYINQNTLKVEQIPPVLVLRMFFMDPSQALSLFLELYGGADEQKKPIWWADNVIRNNRWKQKHGFLAWNEVEAETIREVEMLTQRPEWWIRLYVAALSRADPEFCSPAIIERLGKDSHRLVRRALTAQSSSDLLEP